MSPPPRFNPWRVSTFALALALIGALAGPLATAEAAGPVRLTKALAALRSGKKFLEEAKEPPAPQHAQSLAAVSQAIAAVEREIKAYEAAAARGTPAASASAKPPRKKDEKAPTKKPAPDEGD